MSKVEAGGADSTNELDDSPVAETAAGKNVEAPDDPSDDEIELVIGVTRAVGTPASAAMTQLRNSLGNYGYEVYTIKISDLIRDNLASRMAKSTPPEKLDLRHPSDRARVLIQHGNLMCEEAENNGELAIRAVTEIHDHRIAAAEDDSGADTQDLGDALEVDDGVTQSSRRAYIVDSLKRPEEVQTLRGVYGDHFVLLGLQASERLRFESLLSSYTPHHEGSGEDLRQVALDLMEKDGAEATEFGQDMLRTFPMSDVFVNVDSKESAYDETRRFVEILFDDPQSQGPTAAEHGMQLATQTSALSPELGLRVGAVIVGSNGDVLAAGSNHHPTLEGSPDFDAGAVDVRRLALDTLTMLDDAGLLSTDAHDELATRGSDYVADLLRTDLKEAQIRDVTEYQRPVHAEMNALISAARQRVDLSDATVYVTAYPCHNCAKHLIAVGLKVVYLEPYAKSRATAMYGRDTEEFAPFTGVAPSRFDPWFVSGRSGDRKDRDGVRVEWSPSVKLEATPIVSRHITSASCQKREDYVISRP